MFSQQEMMMTVVTRRLRHLCGVATVVGIFGIAASAALADEAWKAPPPDSYPSGWNVKSAPAPQAYDYELGTGGTELKATGQMPAPAVPQNAQVIYQMVPGGHRYHLITPTQ